MSLGKVYATLLVVVSLIGLGLSIKCYQCSSFTHTQCSDEKFYHTAENGNKIPANNDFLKECPAPPAGKEYTMCRKIYQNVRDDERVIRGCAYEEYKGKGNKEPVCYKTVLEEYNTYVCQCPGDAEKGCNGADASAATSFAALTAAVVLGALLK